MTDIRSISEVLKELVQGLEGERVLIGAVLESLHERGIGFVLFLLALPMALPVPVPPGINVALATPLILLTGQQMMGARTIWLPLSLKRKTVSRGRVNNTLQTLIPWVEKLEVLSKPRLGFITQNFFSRLIGLAGLIMALTVCIPLPLTNTIPSLGIALMALGVIMRDGLAVLAGMAVGLIWVFILCSLVAFLGTEGIDAFKDLIKSFLS